MHFDVLNPNIVVSCPNLTACLRNSAIFDFLHSSELDAASFRQTAPHPYPHYSNIWAYEGQIIRVDLLHLMCRRHVQHGSPQDPNMLKTLTNNYLGHPGNA